MYDPRFQNQGGLNPGFPGGFQQNMMPNYQQSQMGQMGAQNRQTSPPANFPTQPGQQPKPMNQQGGPQGFPGQQFPGQQRPGQPGQPGQPSNYFSGGVPQGNNFLNVPQNPSMANSISTSPRGAFNPQQPGGPVGFPRPNQGQPGQLGPPQPGGLQNSIQNSIQRSVQPQFQPGPQQGQPGQPGQPGFVPQGPQNQGVRGAASPNRGPVQPGQVPPQGQQPFYNQQGQPGVYGQPGQPQPHQQQQRQNPLQYSNYPGQNPAYPQQGQPGYPQQGGQPQQPIQQQPPQQQQQPAPKAASPPKQQQTIADSPTKTISSPGKGKKSVTSEVLSKAMLESKKSDMTYHNISKMSGSAFGTHDAKQTKFASLQEQQEHLDKLFDAAQELEEERKVLADLYAEETMKECTFTPAILPGKAKEIRPSSQFFEDMLAYKQAVEQKIQNLRDQIQEEAPTDDSYHPNICAKSKALANKRANGGVANVHDRLYQEYTKKSKNADEGVREFGRETVFSTKHYTRDGHVPTEHDTFKPSIQEKSKGITRGEKVDDILYKDAKRRQDKTEKIMKAKPRPTEVYVSGNSQKVVAIQFLKQFEAALSKFEGDKLSLLTMANLLHDLGYISPVENLDSPTYLQENTLLTDMWIVLRGDATEGVTKRNLLAFMLAILGFNVPVPKWSEHESPTRSKDIVTNGHAGDNAQQVSEDPFFLACHKAVEDFFAAETAKNTKKKNDKGEESKQQETSNRPTQKPEGTPENQIGWFSEEGDIFFSKEDVKKIQKVYDIFCINKLNTERGKNVKPRHTKDGTHGPEKQQPTFKPEILEYSKKLAEQHREKRKGEIIQLYEYHQQHKTAPETAPAADGAPAGEGNDIARENVEKIINSHAELMFFEKRTQKFNHAQQAAIKLEEEQKECTFKPKILEYKSPHEEDGESPDQGGDDEMKDIKRTRKGITTKSLGKHRAFELYSLAKPAAQKRDRNADEIEYEKYCDECTFMPDVKSKSGNPEVSMKSGANNFMVRNEAQSIDRLRKARETKEQIDYFKEKGYTLNAAIKIETTKFLHSEQEKKRAEEQRNTIPTSGTRGTHQPVQHYREEPQEQEEQEGQEDKQVIYDNQEEDYAQKQADQQEEEPQAESPKNKEEQAEPVVQANQQGTQGERGSDRVPLLFVDVNLGDGKSERIVVYEGDQTEDLAQAFANEHNLDGEMKKRLKELLEKQIKGLLTRIEEEIPSLTSDDEIQSRRRMQQHLQASQQNH